MNDFYQNTRRTVGIFYRLLKGQIPRLYTLSTKTSFYKFPLTKRKAVGVRREVRMSDFAKSTDLYGDKSVTTSLCFSFGAISTRINTEIDLNIHYSKILDLWDYQASCLAECEWVSARKIVEDYLKDLEKDHFLFGSMAQQCTKPEVDCLMPLSFMHGDLSPSNLGIHENMLRIIDWEWASTKGSVILDWWCLRNHIAWLVDTKAVESFVIQSLDKTYFELLSKFDIDQSVVSFHSDFLGKIKRAYIS